jgi:two-component system, LytTR family, response regulator
MNRKEFCSIYLVNWDMHKSSQPLVNVSRIKEINKHFNSCFIIKIDDVAQTRLQSGRGYYEQVKRLMEI